MTPSIGHNINQQLKSIIERIEEEKRGLAADIKEIYAEAKGNGYEPKIIRQIVKMRRQDEGQRREHEELLATYMSALGMLSDTPLGAAAISRVTGGGK